MCGRFTLTVNPADLQDAFSEYTFPTRFSPRFNIAPTQPVLAMPNDGKHEADFFLWGLIPTAMSAAALMTMVGLFFRTYNTVVAGQVIPVFPGTINAPAALSYTPSVSEILLVMAGMGLVGAAFLLGERFFGKAYALHNEH